MTMFEAIQLRRNPDYVPGTRRRPKEPQLTEATKTARYRFRQYGLTPCQHARMRIEQGDLCALCKKSENSRRALAVDHDHETGAIRGLLCGRCNTALGALGDDIAGLERALNYLRVSVPLTFR